MRKLQSLIDFSELAPALPRGHRFSEVQSSLYWSSTAQTAIPLEYGWTVNLRDGWVSDEYKFDNTSFTWAVRGGE